MQNYRPDAIALRSDKKIAIEVVPSAGGSEKRLEDLQSLFASHREWELRVFYISPLSLDRAIDIAPAPAINNSIQRLRDLKTDGHMSATLMMGWATLEAIGRALLPERFRRPQTPARLVEVLASEGFLTPNEADTLRLVGPLRNAVAHGVLDTVVEEKLLDQLLGVLETLASFVSETKR